MPRHHVSCTMTIITFFDFVPLALLFHCSNGNSKVSKHFQINLMLITIFKLKHTYTNNRETNEAISTTSLPNYFSWIILPCNFRATSRLMHQQSKPQSSHPFWYNKRSLPFCMGCSRLHPQSRCTTFELHNIYILFLFQSHNLY